MIASAPAPAGVAPLSIGGVAHQEDACGRTTIERPAERVLVFTTSGHLSAGLATFALAHNTAVLDQLAAAGKKLAGFYDWGTMTSYDGAARTESTKFILARRGQFSSVTILVTSPLVAMAVSVANLLVGGFLHSTTESAKFDAARAAAVRGLRG